MLDLKDKTQPISRQASAAATPVGHSSGAPLWSPLTSKLARSSYAFRWVSASR